MPSRALGLIVFGVGLAACGGAPDSPSGPDGRIPDSPGPDSVGPDSRTPDGQIPDSPGPDSPGPDAYVPDAPSGDFTVSATPGIPDHAAVTHEVRWPISRTITNTFGAPISVDIDLAGDFSLTTPATCALAPGETCVANAWADTATLGDRTGTLTFHSGSEVVVMPLAQRVLVHAEAYVSGGVGTVSSSPAPADCYDPWCFEDGTAITFTAAPGPTSEVAAWTIPACGTGPTCAVTASSVPQYVGVQFMGVPTTLDVDITGFGNVFVLDATTQEWVGQCDASCSLVTDPTHELIMAASTPGYLASVDGVAETGNEHGGTERFLAMGATHVSVEFAVDPGEQFLDGTQAAYSPNGDLAISDGATTTVRDAVLAIRWSVPGARPIFDLAGELIVVAGGSTKKYDAAGALLATLPGIAYANPTPSGGLLAGAGPAVTVYDASFAPVLTLPLAGDFTGCAGASASGYFVSIRDSLLNDEYEVFSPTGTLTYQSSESAEFYPCHLAPDYGGGFISSWGALQHATGVEASGNGAYVSDYANSQPYDAAADAAHILYWFVTQDYFDYDASGFLLRAYSTTNGAPPIWTFARDGVRMQTIAYQGVGVTAHSIAISPDGHQALAVTWYLAGNDTRDLIDIRAPH